MALQESKVLRLGHYKIATRTSCLLDSQFTRRIGHLLGGGNLQETSNRNSFLYRSRPAIFSEGASWDLSPLKNSRQFLKRRRVSYANESSSINTEFYLSKRDDTDLPDAADFTHMDGVSCCSGDFASVRLSDF